MTDTQKELEIKTIKANRIKINELMLSNSNFKPLSIYEKDFLVYQNDINLDILRLIEINEKINKLDEIVQKSAVDSNLLIENIKGVRAGTDEVPTGTNPVREGDKISGKIIELGLKAYSCIKWEP